MLSELKKSACNDMLQLADVFNESILSIQFAVAV